MSWLRHRRPRIGGGIEMTLDLFAAAGGGQDATVGAGGFPVKAVC